ncbi:MAG: MFS transporter [Thermoanaerobaculia bacterium]|nr:MFS transporter [Thermoanaerobaculia bacterium]
MSSSVAPRFEPERRRAVTIALLLVTALSSFESTVVSTAMPTIIGELHGLPLYSWVFSIYLLASTITMPIYGRLADVYGRRRVLMTATVVFLAGALACALARSMPQLIVARGLQGLGAGGLIPIALTVTGDLYSLEERARVQALFSGVWGFASLVGPLLGAFLTVTFGWRSIFTINVPLGLVALFLVATKMRESRKPGSDPLDVAGALTLALGIGALLFAVLQSTGAGALGTGARLLLGVAGFALLGLFARLQAGRRHPLIPPDLFRHADTAAPYVGGILLGTTIYGVDTFVPLFVQGARGGTAGAAGAVITPLVLFWALSAVVAARIIVRFGFRTTARAGALLILAGFVGLLAAARFDAPVAAISAACGLIGAGLGPSSLSQVLAIQNVVEESRRGVATSLVPFFRTVGGSLGVGALGGILATGLTRRMGAAAESAGTLLTEGHVPREMRLALEQSLLPVFAVLLVLALVNLAVTSRFPDRRARPRACEIVPE